jgi:hypothetical protein
LEKAAIEDDSRKAKLIIEENERLNKENMRFLAEKEAERILNEQNIKIEKQKQRDKNLAELEKHQLIIDIYKEKIDKILKKSKNLKKKLRDILDLQLKVEMSGIKITKDQKDKLDRKQEIEDDIAELNEELDILESNEPPHIPDYLLELDNDIITDNSSSPIEVNNDHIDTLVKECSPNEDSNTCIHSPDSKELKVMKIEEKKIIVDRKVISFQGAAE